MKEQHRRFSGLLGLMISGLHCPETLCAPIFLPFFQSLPSQPHLPTLEGSSSQLYLLRFPRHFLLLLFIPLLSLALEELALLVGTHALEARVTGLLLAPIDLDLALLGALALVRFPQLARFLLAYLP